MSNIYSPQKTTSTSKNFQAFFNVDPNAWVSSVLKQSLDESRRLYNDSPIPHAIIDTLTRYVIGTGLTPKSAPDREYLGWSIEEGNAFTREAESFFNLITGSPDFDFYGKDNFNTLQQEAFKTILISGDILLHRTYSDKSRRYKPYIQLIAGDWVRNTDLNDTKKNTGGVIFDERGKEIGYEIVQTDYNRLDTFFSKAVSRYNSRTNFKEFDLIKLQSQQSGLVRGIPLLNPVKESILLVTSFERSYVTKALVQSLMTVFLESEEQTSSVLSGMDAIKEAAMPKMQNDEPDVDGIELGPGIVVRLAPGEKANVAESKIDGADYETFINKNLDIIGAGAGGVPRELILQSFNSSYSASKGTLASAEKGFAIYRSEFQSKFNKPIWEQVIDYGIRIGAIRMPKGYADDPLVRNAVLSCKWIGPTPVALDPVKEIQATKLAVDSRFMTMEQAIQQLNGGNFDETQDRIDRERERIPSSSSTQETAQKEETNVEDNEENEDK